MDACTIIAKNYVAHARVLARSLQAQHPDARLHVLVIDELDGFIDPADEPFAVVTVAELEIDGFAGMAARYDVVELSTAVKPWLMRWLLARSADGVAVYLDPDTRVYAPLDGVFDAVAAHGLVLSPHSLGPLPRDGKRPSEQDILGAGAYNLGFIGLRVGPSADALLDWWAERLLTDCIVDPKHGLFVDQRWVDLVPGMADSFHLLRDGGFNVAYWNASARPVRRDAGGSWRAGDVPLRLFHFSGFDETQPYVLSRHQNRIRLADHPDLAQLCVDYADELVAAGAEVARDWPYTYATTASGMALNGVVRKAYRKLAAAGDVGDLFDPAQERSFLAQLNAPASEEEGGGAGVTNYLAALYEERADLRHAYPDLTGPDAAGYLGWARVFAIGEVPPQLRPPAGGDAPAVAPPAQPRPSRAARPPVGVNVAGYLDSALGVGEVARQAIRALDAAAVPVLPVGIAANAKAGAKAGAQRHAFTHRDGAQGGYPVNLICVNADMLPSFAGAAGPAFFAGRWSIGWWWWEVSEFPARWRGSFEHLDELWAGSSFVAEALAPVSPVPVVRVPLPVSVAGVPRANPRRFGLPPGFSYLFCFDYASVLARKNPLGCIDAFLRAFPDPGDAVLVLKSVNGDEHPGDQDRVRLAAAGHPHIVLIDEYLDPADKDRLVATCDCYLSLHRSEGFGITMAEAMLLGKPVIATGYSGNLDFMTQDNSYLVDHALTPIGAGAGPYPANARWAEPDLDHAAMLMREVYEDRAGAQQRAQHGQADIRRTHSAEAAGAIMARRLRAIAGRGPAADGGWETPAALARVELADAALRAAAQPGANGRRDPRSIARRLAVRVLRPHLAHQAKIDRDLVDALQAIGRDVRELGERGVAVEALALRGGRDVEQRLHALLDEQLAAGSTRAEDLAREVAELRALLAQLERLA